MTELVHRVRTNPRARLLVLGVLVIVAVGIGLLARSARAMPYVNPFWAGGTPSQESPLPEVAGLAMSPEGVDLRTGELFWSHELFTTPGVHEDNVFSFTWRSMIQGSSQLGNGILPSWETTAQLVVLNAQNPNGPNGHRVDIRRSSGRIDQFNWNGSAYSAPPGVYDTLAINGTGTYFLLDKNGGTFTFDQFGMPAQWQPIAATTYRYSYNAAFQITSMIDDRGQPYGFASNPNGYLTSITDPYNRVWTFTYDGNDNLVTITTPGTPDQPGGIVNTLSYDGQNRLVAVTDGRGNTVWSFSYVGASRRVASVTIDGNTVSYSYGAGVTTRTDRNGNAHRTYYAGNQVTKTETLVGGSPKFVRQFRYSSIYPANVVLPRGNRIDFLYDPMGNVTSRRHRTQDTSVNAPSDLVHTWTYNTAGFSTSYTDPRGNQWLFARDAKGNLTMVTHPAVTKPVSQIATKSYQYNTQSQVTRIVDEEGNQTDYTYYTSGPDQDLLQKIEVDPNGLDLETLYTYDAWGNVATRTDARGNTWTYQWDPLRRLKQREAPSPLGYIEKYVYDGNHNRTKRDFRNVDKDLNEVAANPWWTTDYTYTPTDHLATIVEEIDASTTRTTTLQYDANQNRIRVIKPQGNKEKWEFDERDRVVKHIRGEGDAAASESLYEYDENDNLTAETDGRANVTLHAYDLFDRRTRTTNALGHYTEWQYDANGNGTKVMRKDAADVEVQRESYAFDERNRRWQTSALFREGMTTHPDAVTTWERFKTGQVKIQTDPLGNQTTLVLDAASRLTKITDAIGNEWSFTLDASGNRTAWTLKEIDGVSSVTHGYEATYDELDRRATYVEIDRNNASNRLTTQYLYDSRSNTVFKIDAENNPTRWTYDGLGRMTKREQALTLGGAIDVFNTAQVTEWGWDSNNRLISHKDDGTNVSTWTWDALDRKTQLVYPDNKKCAYEYDANDNIVKVTDPAGNVIEDVFDPLNRNTNRTVTLATGFAGTTAEMRTFDAVNRIVANADDDYRLDYAYSEIGLDSYVRQETQQYVGGAPYPKTVTKSYDAAGNRVAEGYPSGANLALVYGYDAIHNLTSISDGTNTLSSTTWIGLRKKQTTYQSGATRLNVYTGFRQELQSVQHQTSGQAPIVQLDYAYNKVHDRIYERFGGGGSSGDAFAYDKMRRLTNAWMGSTNPVAPTANPYVKKIDYNYDDDGNRGTVVVTPFGMTPVTTNYTTNTLNIYTNVGGTPQVSDANGNLTDNGTFLFTYDYKNLITHVWKKSDASLVATYRYDAEGRRVEKAGLEGTERYIRSRVREAEGSSKLRNNPGGGGRYDMSHVVAVYDDLDTWLQSFVWNDEVDGIEVLEQADVLDHDGDMNTSELTRSFYHRNALGSVMEITDANQAPVVSYRYDPYGRVTITRGGMVQTTDPLGQHWGFTGRFHDEESGLAYYRARYYDPETGRFVQRDPLGYADGPNLYCYVRSDPANRTDPTGLWGIEHMVSERPISTDPEGNPLPGCDEFGDPLQEYDESEDDSADDEDEEGESDDDEISGLGKAACATFYHPTKALAKASYLFDCLTWAMGGFASKHYSFGDINKKMEQVANGMGEKSGIKPILDFPIDLFMPK